MSSKLALLARYAPAKASSKADRRKDGSGGAGTSGRASARASSTTRAVIVEDADTVPGAEQVQDSWDAAEEEGPAPEQLRGAYASRGEWTVEEEGAAGQGERADSSPPRRSRLLDRTLAPAREGASELHLLRPGHRDGDDASPPRKPKSARLEHTSSGHAAGLQTGAAFGQAEQRIAGRRDLALQATDPGKAGAGAETVYRDRQGKKLDMLSEFMRQQSVAEGKERKIAQAQHEWGRGSVQRSEAADRVRELEEIAAEPFARLADDPKLERMRKELVRDGDPMAAYVARRGGAGEGKVGPSKPSKPSKPEYAGPAAPPNRFRLRPGYRWDAIDRGSGFERKVLLRMSERGGAKEDEYRWSVSDL